MVAGRRVWHPEPGSGMAGDAPVARVNATTLAENRPP